MHAFDYYPIYFRVPIAFIDHNSSQNRVKKEDEQEIDVYGIAYSKVLQNLCIVPNYIMGICYALCRANKGNFYCASFSKV